MSMTVYLKSMLAVILLPAMTAASATPQNGPADDVAAVTAVILSYQDALNASNTDAAIALYSEDGVLMPPYSHSVVGKAAVRDAYRTGSKVFALHVKFTIAEVVQVAPTWAFVRTNSAGTSKASATGTISAENNQELFILRKDVDGNWRIARYSFSTTGPTP